MLFEAYVLVGRIARAVGCGPACISMSGLFHFEGVGRVLRKKSGKIRWVYLRVQESETTPRAGAGPWQGTGPDPQG